MNGDTPSSDENDLSVLDGHSFGVDGRVAVHSEDVTTTIDGVGGARVG